MVNNEKMMKEKMGLWMKGVTFEDMNKRTE